MSFSFIPVISNMAQTLSPSPLAHGKSPQYISYHPHSLAWAIAHDPLLHMTPIR